MHLKRKLIEDLENQKNQMVAALWSNSNWDDDKGSRKKAINDLLAQHEEALEAIEASMMSRKTDVEEEALDKNNPFFQATERGLQKIEKRFESSGGKIQKKDEIDYMKGLDQE